MSEVTQILSDIRQGVPDAQERLLAVVYDELRRVATRKLARESPGQTLQTTALVHEAYLRLVGSAGDADTPAEPDGRRQTGWQSRGHFFAAAAEAMRRILIDNARRKNRMKHGGDRSRVELDSVSLAISQPEVDLMALDEALSKLELHHSMKADVVKLRYFAGLTLEEVAQALEVSVPTVHRHWRYARAWLRREIEGMA